MSADLHTLRVDLSGAPADRSYPIVIGRGLLGDSTLWSDWLGDRSVVLVTNSSIEPLYADVLAATLGTGRVITRVVLPDGESHKHLSSIEQILSAALEAHHERRSVFVALGGGVIGDMTGFAAACFLRGVDFIQVPTTLLAQVDSSVGGKTGVNHPIGKNLIGAFHQPRAVAIDLDTLATLPDREFAAGMAEVVKYGLIYDAAFFAQLLQDRDALLARDSQVLAAAIERSCAIKAAVVAQDERESGLRAILDFGHTFGHAIEQVQGYGEWLHGEAVAAGMVIAARLSASRGWVNAAVVTDLEAFLATFGLPVAPPSDMAAEDFLAVMANDKKVDRGQIRYVLLPELGRAALFSDVSEAEIAAAIG